MIIVIEGGDQAGKKTQSMLLAKAFRKRKLKTQVFNFPDYTTPIGKEINKFLHGKRKFPPQTIHCLLAAHRGEKLDEIKKKSKRDKFEKNKQFSNKISQTYRKLAKKKHWKVVKAVGTKEEIHKSIMQLVSKKLLQ